jgi:hypothetical protein
MYPSAPRASKEPRDLQRVFFGKTSGLSRATGRTGTGSGCSCYDSPSSLIVSHHLSSCWLQEPEKAGHF